MRAPTTLLESANREKCPTPYQSASKRLAQQAVKWEFQEPQVLGRGSEPRTRCAGFGEGAKIGNRKEPKATMRVTRIWDGVPSVPS